MACATKVLVVKLARFKQSSLFDRSFRDEEKKVLLHQSNAIMLAAVAQSLGHSTRDRMKENRRYTTLYDNTKKANAFPYFFIDETLQLTDSVQSLTMLRCNFQS